MLLGETRYKQNIPAVTEKIRAAPLRPKVPPILIWHSLEREREAASSCKKDMARQRFHSLQLGRGDEYCSR